MRTIKVFLNFNSLGMLPYFSRKVTVTFLLTELTVAGLLIAELLRNPTHFERPLKELKDLFSSFCCKLFC